LQRVNGTEEQKSRLQDPALTAPSAGNAAKNPTGETTFSKFKTTQDERPTFGFISRNYKVLHSHLTVLQKR
jgi:hypothetical protein